MTPPRHSVGTAEASEEVMGTERVFAMWNLTTLKTTGQQRVAVLVKDVGEVLTRHEDARRSGLLQTIHKVPFLFQRRTLLGHSTSVL